MRKYGAKKQRQKIKRNTVVYALLMALFAAVFLVCAGMLLHRFWSDRQAESEFSGLEAMIDETPAAAADAQGAATGAADGAAPVTSAPETGNAAKFARLVAQNPDFKGWISIPGTNLSFPVMQRVAEKNFYLRHDFDGEYSVYGVPYLDEGCRLDAGGQSENLIIYGHNMKTGTIFGCLTGYKKPEYYAGHPTITFDTLYGDAEYEVFAAFAIDVVEDPDFVYNSFTGGDQAAFDAYVGEVLRRSDVASGITPAYGDALLTLSTCEYSTDNGRYVVVARRAAGAGA